MPHCTALQCIWDLLLVEVVGDNIGVDKSCNNEVGKALLLALAILVNQCVISNWYTDIPDQAQVFFCETCAMFVVH